MRILVVVSGPAQGSGVRSAAGALGGVFEQLGHEVRSLSVDTRPRRTGNRVNLENAVSVARDIRSIWRSVRMDGPDVVWLHTLGFPLLPATRTIAMVLPVRLQGIPAVSHLHAYGLDDQSLTGHRAGRVALRMLCRLSNQVVVLHDRSAQALRQIACLCRVSVLPNVVDVVNEPTPPPVSERFRMVFVGGLVRRKGVPELLGALRLLDDSFELHLVGGPGEDGVADASAVVKDAADLVTSGRVVFEGELDDAGVRAQLDAADLFVLPSHAEGTPIALLEALAHGRPVLVSDAGNMGDIVRASECGVVLDRIDPQAIADALCEMRTSPAALLEQGRRAYEMARSSFSADSASERAEEILAAQRRNTP